jgi:microcin C transport system substrate-binding protein
MNGRTSNWPSARYTRCNSYFSNSVLAATEPTSMEELKLLEPFRDQLDPRVFSEVYQPPKTKGTGDIRDNLRKATQVIERSRMEDG